MFAHSVSVRLKANRVAEFTHLIDTQAVPLLRKQKGFQDELTFLVPGGMEAIAISLWDEKENADSFGRRGYLEILKNLEKMVEMPPAVRIFQVYNSTFHKVAAPAAA